MREHDTSKTGELYCDTRLHGVEQWYYGEPRDANMRVPEVILRSVCFLCVKVQGAQGERDHFIGTGCFMQMPYAIPGYVFSYLVTAKHVITDIKELGYQDIYVRVNKRDGGSETLKLYDRWVYPENPSVDVAALPLSPDGRIFEFNQISPRMFADHSAVEEFGIGVGDDLVITGLFSKRWGHGRNIPIVRSGSIAAMPDEPFIDETGEIYNAYLVEMRSIGGLSGSPVFAMMPPTRWVKGGKSIPVKPRTWKMLFLGLVRGHWNLDREDAATDSSQSEMERLNTGIAQVTPAEDVLSLLNHEVFMKQRDEQNKQALKRNAPEKDANLPDAVTERGHDSGALTPDSFDEALRRASRRVTPSGTEKAEE